MNEFWKKWSLNAFCIKKYPQFSSHSTDIVNVLSVLKKCLCENDCKKKL